MKKIFALAACMLLTLSAFAQSGKSIYTKYSDAENVSAVYISSAMFRLMKKLPDMEIQGSDLNLGSIVSSLSGMYILNSRNDGVNRNLAKDAQSFISKGKYEMLMEAKDNGEVMHIYTMGDEKTVNGFVLLATEPTECTFICLDGSMPREALENLISSSLQ